MADTYSIIAELKAEKDIFKKAKLLHIFHTEKQIPIKDLARYLRLSSSYICHIMRLNRLPEMVIDGYYAKLVSLTHLFILSRVKNREQVMEIYEKLLTHNHTVQKLEETVREYLHNVKSEGSVLSSDKKQEYKDIIHKKIQNSEVSIVQTRIKSAVKITVKGSLMHTTAEIEKVLRKITE